MFLSVEDGEQDVGYSWERNSTLDPASLAAAEVEQVQSAAAASNCEKSPRKILFQSEQWRTHKVCEFISLNHFRPPAHIIFRDACTPALAAAAGCNSECAVPGCNTTCQQARYYFQELWLSFPFAPSTRAQETMGTFGKPTFGFPELEKSQVGK